MPAWVHRDFDDVLKDVKKYLNSDYDYGIAPGTISSSNYRSYVAFSTTFISTHIEYSSMSRIPSITMYSRSTGASGNARESVTSTDVAGWSFANMGRSRVFLYNSSNNLTVDHLYEFFVVFDARL